MFGLEANYPYLYRSCCNSAPYWDNGAQNEYALMLRNNELQRQQLYYTQSTYPYGLVTNFTGTPRCTTIDTNIPYPMAVRMNNSLNGGLNLVTATPEEVKASVSNFVKTSALQNKFQALQASIPAMISSLTSLAQTNGLTAAQKNEINKYIKVAEQIQATLEKIQNNKNEQVSVALEQVEALCGLYTELQEKAAKLAQSIASGSTTTPETNNNETVTTPETNIEGGTVPEATGETLDEIKNQYKTELVPVINQVLNECKDTMTAQDRKAVIDKVKELKQAIKDKKEVEEVKRIYNELTKMLEKHIENAPIIAAYKEVGIGEAIKEIMAPDNKEVSAADKAAVKKAKARYDAEMKKSDNAVAKQDALEALYKAIQKIDEKGAAKASKICSKIYSLANGTDWTSSQEAALRSTVLGINKYLVIDVLDQWVNKNYPAKTGDNGGIMETIFGEFKSKHGVKRELAEHMLKQLEAVAAKRKVDISAEAAVIRGEIKQSSTYIEWATQYTWNYSAIYNAFNEIHAKLGNPITDVDKQAAAVKQEAAEQQTPADEQAARKAA